MLVDQPATRQQLLMQPFKRFVPNLRLAMSGLLLVFFLGISDASTAQAGLSASDVVVVVNASSMDSRTLANHYVALRNIPAVNVVVLADIPNQEVVSVEEFRAKILRPLLTELERRKLLDHIQCIAYSADFPSAIDISADLKDIKDLHTLFTPVASINGATYLYSSVLAREPSYISLYSNFYARREMAAYFTNPSGEKTQAEWDAAQALVQSDKHQEASEAFEKLYQQQTHQAPVAYLAAAEAAVAGDKTRALKLLQAAITAGWSGSRHLANDTRFDSLRADAAFQVLEFSLDDSVKELQPASGFEARTSWTPNGVPTPQPQFGRRYLLSTVLGVTRGAGTTLTQAIASLRRSAAADFSHPQGGFYFSLTSDVRTTTRQLGFVAAIDDLQLMGHTAEMIPDVLPVGKASVLGAQIGTPSFDWNTCGSTLVPGAIVDNLTSLGGVMTSGAGQTNLSELIKAGAAGSSGAVVEPYALQEKFPHPQMYVHYARGASLAEAFYLSVTGPYQLLILGDPLCQPFSHAPQPSFDPSLRTLDANQPLSLEFQDAGQSYSDWLDSATPEAQRNKSFSAETISLLLDGLNVQRGAMQSKFNIALRGQPPGYHAIVLQFGANTPLSPRSHAVVPLWIGPENTVEISLPDTSGAASSSPKEAANPNGLTYQISASSEDIAAKEITVHVQAASGQRVSLWHDSEQIGSAAGTQADFSVALSSLGLGPVRLHAQVQLPDGRQARSIPTVLEVLIGPNP